MSAEEKQDDCSFVYEGLMEGHSDWVTSFAAGFS